MISNPLYHLDADHLGGLVGLLDLALAIGVVLWLARLGYRPAAIMRERYGRLAATDRLLAGCLAASAAVHLGLFAHDGPLGPLFVVDGLVLGSLALRIVAGRPARLPAAIVLFGSLAGWWVAVVGGEPPDQLALATKLIELTGLTILIRPAPGSRLRAVSATVLTTVLVVVTGLAGWTGSFAAAAAGAGRAGAGSTPGAAQAGIADEGHGHGAAPGPTVVMDIAAAGSGPATTAQATAADRFYATTLAAIARFADPAAAQAAGYRLDGLHGVDFHAANEAYQHDGRVLDPARPEMLVYAASARGPLLLGAVFVMPGLHESGPAVGGPLTAWHAHEDVCLSLLPPGLSGALSPLGDCPVGSLTFPLTAEMLHVWVVPGTPTRFGDLPEAWRRAYVARAGS